MTAVVAEPSFCRRSEAWAMTKREGKEYRLYMQGFVGQY